MALKQLYRFLQKLCQKEIESNVQKHNLLKG